MGEKDDTDPSPDPNNECIDSFARQTVETLARNQWRILERLRELEAKVEDLHATDSARRLNKATEDPEWY